jgi:hypothetical protein
MPPAKGIPAGRAFVELFADSSKLVRGLKRASAKLKAFGARVREIGLRMAKVTAALFAPIGILSIKAASAAEETQSRFEQVFRDQAAAAGRFADAVAEAVGRSRYAIRDALSTFQSFFTGMGFDAAKSRELSQQLQSLALDFASFHNIADDEAVGRFISALSGSSEVLDRFGINIKQAALQQELLRMGIRKSWQEVTEQEKALARLNVITRAMGDQGAVGDAVRTAGSFANRMKALKGQLHDTAVEIGRGLLPAVTPLVRKVAAAAKAFADWARQNKALVGTIFKVAAGVIGVGLALAVLGTAIRGFGIILAGFAAALKLAIGLLAVAKLSVLALLSPIGLVIAAVATLAAAVLVATGAMGKLLRWLGDRWRDLKDEALEAYDGIAAALASGDIALAAKILWLTLKMWWIKGTNALGRVWREFLHDWRVFGITVWHGLKDDLEDLWHGLSVAWIETTAFLSKTWTRFCGGVSKAWHWTGNKIQKAWNWLKSQFDSDFDREAANRAADQAWEAKKREIESETQAALASREAERERDRRIETKTHERRKQQIKRDYERAIVDLQKEHDSKLKAAEDDLAAAKDEWRKAIAAARKRREAGEPPGMPGMPGMPEAAGGAGAFADAMRAQQQRTETRGAFNPFALRFFDRGAVNIQERTAKAAEEILREARDINRNTTTGAVFE